MALKNRMMFCAALNKSLGIAFWHSTIISFIQQSWVTNFLWYKHCLLTGIQKYEGCLSKNAAINASIFHVIIHGWILPRQLSYICITPAPRRMTSGRRGQVSYMWSFTVTSIWWKLIRLKGLRQGPPVNVQEILGKSLSKETRCSLVAFFLVPWRSG